ncbi:MAG: hypothetical protein Ta2E_12970 [Mycoplasmoidaceae bacterium]|nr:MAG: hypothetical protein Ta2E_12970 [Mycoplasmoidaceae bacterium]
MNFMMILMINIIPEVIGIIQVIEEFLSLLLFVIETKRKGEYRVWWTFVKNFPFGIDSICFLFLISIQKNEKIKLLEGNL